MPAEGISLVKHSDILSFDEIVEVTSTAVKMGITKVRLTGGEPLVRRGIEDLTGMIAGIDGIQDLSMTTNGILLSKFAALLAKAGLMRVNISLDTMDPDKYKEITRGGDLSDVLQGIKAALDAGLNPVKINCVIQKSSDEPDARSVATFCQENNLQIRYIPQMILENGTFSRVEGGDGGNCAICNRLRLTATGKIQPCLFSDLEFDVRELGIKKALETALKYKPECGSLNHHGRFYNIGG
jgi:cyclic pyranopterin phosphate synthase